MTNSNNNKKMENKFTGKKAVDSALELFTDMMIEKIKTIQKDWKKPWFTEGAINWPCNLSGREYNGMNALMLTIYCEKQGYKHPIFCTFDRVMSFNYTTTEDGQKVRYHKEDGTQLPILSVRKGEKSFPVFILTFTCVGPDGKIKYEDYKNLAEDARKDYAVYPALKVFHVFNIDQTNMKEVRPKFYDKIIKGNMQSLPTMESDGFAFEPLDRLISEQAWICPISVMHQDRAFYSITNDSITVPEKEQFLQGEKFYGNLLHEMAHSTGSEKHLNRVKATEFGSDEYATEELIAELTAALCANRYGMKKFIEEDSAPYLKSWLKALKKSPEFIRSILTDVKKASFMITQKIDTMTVPEA